MESVLVQAAMLLVGGWLAVGILGCGVLPSPNGRPLRLVPRICPDGGPVKWLQDPSCGRACGYSCLPERWTTASA